MKTDNKDTRAKKNLGGTYNFPAILQLKRISIRFFPDKKVVALYYSNALKKYFSIPSTNNGEPVVEEKKEDSLKNEINRIVKIPNRLKVRDYKKPLSVLYQLRDIVRKKQATNIQFKDGTKRTVDLFTASAIVKTHKRLKDKNNKLRFAMLLNRDKNKFNDVLHFTKKYHE